MTNTVPIYDSTLDYKIGLEELYSVLLPLINCGWAIRGCRSENFEQHLQDMCGEYPKGVIFIMKGSPTIDQVFIIWCDCNASEIHRLISIRAFL